MHLFGRLDGFIDGGQSHVCHHWGKRIEIVAVLIHPAGENPAFLCRRRDLFVGAISLADGDRSDFSAAVGLKGKCAQHRRQAVEVSHQIILHHLHINIVHGAIRVDVGFGEVNTGFFLLFDVPFHQVDVQQLHLAVPIGVTVQDSILGKCRQGVQRNDGKQDTEGQYQAYNPFLHSRMPPLYGFFSSVARLRRSDGMCRFCSCPQTPISVPGVCR